ncbi:hypothetical protein V5O48_010868, partial [Marasmius crinis-equi]
IDGPLRPSPHLLSGVIPEFRDSLAEWRYYLNHRGSSRFEPPDLFLCCLADLAIQDLNGLQGRDRDLILHVAAPAKAYGFRFLLGRLWHNVWYLNGLHCETSYNWATFRPDGTVLDGQEAHYMQSRLAAAWKAQEKELTAELTARARVEAMEERNGYNRSQVRLKNTRKATYLIVLPN